MYIKKFFPLRTFYFLFYNTVFHVFIRMRDWSTLHNKFQNDAHLRYLFLRPQREMKQTPELSEIKGHLSLDLSHNYCERLINKKKNCKGDLLISKKKKASAVLYEQSLWLFHKRAESGWHLLSSKPLMTCTDFCRLDQVFSFPLCQEQHCLSLRHCNSSDAALFD